MDDLKTARGLRIEVVVNPGWSNVWLEILVSKQHWSICEMYFDSRLRSEFQRISRYLDDNTWETPWSVVEWLGTWLPSGIVVVGNIGRWNGKEETDDRNS